VDEDKDKLDAWSVEGGVFTHSTSAREKGVLPPTWKSNRTVYTGEVAMSESGSDALSDLIRFPPIRKDSKVSSTLQFYSDEDGGKNDKAPPDTKAVPKPEEALGKLDDRVAMGPGSIDTTYDPKIDLSGRSGLVYRVKSGDETMPGSNTVAGTLPITYVFVSDTDAAKSTGKSVHYDQFSKSLSFSNDHITSTGTDGDPLVGAAVNMPTFHLQGSPSDGQVLFDPPSGAQLTLGLGASTYLTAAVGELTYVKSENSFSAVLSHVFASGVDPKSPLYDPNLASIDSTFLHYLDTVFNPDSGLFDPTASLLIRYTPDSDFFSETSGFTMSGESSITNVVTVGSVPEPSPLLLLTSGLAGLMAWRRVNCAAGGKRGRR